MYVNMTGQGDQLLCYIPIISQSLNFDWKAFFHFSMFTVSRFSGKVILNNISELHLIS